MTPETAAAGVSHQGERGVVGRLTSVQVHEDGAQPDVPGRVDVGIRQPGVLAQGQDDAVVAVTHPPGAEVTLLRASLGGSGALPGPVPLLLLLLLVAEGLDPGRGKPAVRQASKDTVGGARCRRAQPASLGAGGEGLSPRGGTPSCGRPAGGPRVRSARHVRMGWLALRGPDLRCTGGVRGPCCRGLAGRRDVALSLSEPALIGPSISLSATNSRLCLLVNLFLSPYIRWPAFFKSGAGFPGRIPELWDLQTRPRKPGGGAPN